MLVYKGEISSIFTRPDPQTKQCKLKDGVLDTLYDKVCLLLATDLWFSLGTPVPSTNKTYLHDIPLTEILLKVMLNTIILTITPIFSVSNICQC